MINPLPMPCGTCRDVVTAICDEGVPSVSHLKHAVAGNVDGFAYMLGSQERMALLGYLDFFYHNVKHLCSASGEEERCDGESEPGRCEDAREYHNVCAYVRTFGVWEPRPVFNRVLFPVPCLKGCTRTEQLQ